MVVRIHHLDNLVDERDYYDPAQEKSFSASAINMTGHLSGDYTGSLEEFPLLSLISLLSFTSR